MVNRVRPLNALRRKLLRELWQLRVQMLSIALVVAVGVMSVVTMRGAYDSLLNARTDYYRQTRFADAWAPLVRARVIQVICGADRGRPRRPAALPWHA